jgi:WD40 repeat protein
MPNQTGTVTSTSDTLGIAADASLLDFSIGGEQVRSQQRRCKTPSIDWLAVINMNAFHRFDVSLLRILEHSSPASNLRFSPDAEVIATVCEASVHIFDLKTGAKLNTLSQNKFFTRNERIRSICFSPDGKHIATSNEGGRIHMWSRQEQKLCLEFANGPSRVLALSFSSDGNSLVSVSENAITTHDITLRRMINAVKLPFQADGTHASQIAISPNCKFVAACYPGDPVTYIKVWETTTGMVALEKELWYCLHGQLTFSPASDEIMYASQTLGMWRSSIGVVTDGMGDSKSNVVEPRAPEPPFQYAPVGFAVCGPDGEWIIPGGLSCPSEAVILRGAADGESQFILWGPQRMSTLTSNISGLASNALAVISNSVVYSVAHASRCAGGVFAISGSDFNRVWIWQYKM